jgi:hypothetical protein
VKEIKVAAPVEAVSKALRDGTELARWFPLEATFEPGVGGKLRLSWAGLGSDCAVDERLAGAGGIFGDGAGGKLREGGMYSLRTSTGEA